VNEAKRPRLDHSVHDLIARRWSPYGFDDRPVPEEDLLSLFEAARWAPSSFNEQPWRYIVANRHDAAEFDRLLSCLTEGNQKWARHAPVLALGIVKRDFTRNGKPNKAAHHDLGLASAHLTFEATARDLFVHQMVGIVPERARELYDIPEDHEAFTALAIGRLGHAPGKLAERDTKTRTRRPLQEFVFSGSFGVPLQRST
jgi:nitroreductase